jgi:hypothetical protein
MFEQITAATVLHRAGGGRQRLHLQHRRSQAMACPDRALLKLKPDSKLIHLSSQTRRAQAGREQGLWGPLQDLERGQRGREQQGVGWSEEAAGLPTAPELGLRTEQGEAESSGVGGYGGEGRPWRPVTARKQAVRAHLESTT